MSENEATTASKPIDWPNIAQTVRLLRDSLMDFAAEREADPDTDPSLPRMYLSRLRTFARSHRKTIQFGGDKGEPIEYVSAWRQVCLLVDEFTRREATDLVSMSDWLKAVSDTTVRYIDERLGQAPPAKSADCADTPTDTKKKSRKPRRPDQHAIKCGRLYRSEKLIDPELTLKSAVESYVADNPGVSETGLYKRLLDNPSLYE